MKPDSMGRDLASQIWLNVLSVDLVDPEKACRINSARSSKDAPHFI